MFVVVLGLLLVVGALMAGSAVGAIIVVALCAGFYGLLYALYNRGARLEAVQERGVLVRVRGATRDVPWAQVSAVERRRVVVKGRTTLWFDIHLGRATDPDATSVSVTASLDGARTVERAIDAIVRGAGLTWSGDAATRVTSVPRP